MPSDVAPFRIAIVAGVSIGRWTKAWKERRPDTPLEVIPISESEQRSVLTDGIADVSFVRLPIDREDLSVIRLYSEVAVVVVPKEHPIALFDSVTEADLAGEIVRTEDPADAVEVVAAGVGVLRVPHSVARQYARKDVQAVPVTDAPETEIAIAWPTDSTSPDVEYFVGIVRGRKASSSRGETLAAPPPRATTTKRPAHRSGTATKGGKSGKPGGGAAAKAARKRGARGSR